MWPSKLLPRQPQTVVAERLALRIRRLEKFPQPLRDAFHVRLDTNGRAALEAGGEVALWRHQHRLAINPCLQHYHRDTLAERRQDESIAIRVTRRLALVELRTKEQDFRFPISDFRFLLPDVSPWNAEFGGKMFQFIFMPALIPTGEGENPFFRFPILRPGFQQIHQSLLEMDAAQEQKHFFPRLDEAMPRSIADCRLPIADCRQINAVRDDGDGICQAKLAKRSGLGFAQRPQTTGIAQVRALVEKVRDDFFPVRIPHSPRIEHSVNRDDIRDALAAAILVDRKSTRLN